ncbi:unnamed protein product [Symbiodinium natans]|uniref:Uncharacterized protein n=1 Tax=Symbiodinium natans TaxID=878477 RepID=A0A812J3S4_9DINO|nr:unnamed protein product [Symbiodinium natans]
MARLCSVALALAVVRAVEDPKVRIYATPLTRDPLIVATRLGRGLCEGNFEEVGLAAEAAAISDLGSDLENKMHESLRSAEHSARQRAESELGISHEQLSERFVSLQKEAASDVAKSHVDSARQVLEEMEAADAKLAKVESRTAKLLNDASRHIEDSGRDAARNARDQADRLAREARHQTDHLDRVARKFDLPDMSDRFDRMAETAARHVSDVAEKGARTTEDAARSLPRQFDAQVAKARLRRREALRSVRELVESAGDKAAVGMVAEPDNLDTRKDVRLLVVGAASAGAAAAVLVAFVLRHAFRSDEDMDKYLLVV